MKKWTIQVTYDSSKDDGKKFRARTVFWTEAEDLLLAYKNAEESFKGREDIKLGAILPGHHGMMP